MRYTGNLSFYFPCSVKSSRRLDAFNKRWRRWHWRQVHHIHHTYSPLTDLMDMERNRRINESLLTHLRMTIGGEECNDELSPFALKCMQRAYRRNREDNLFAKNVQYLLSRFRLTYNYDEERSEKTMLCEGLLLLNVNADNSIATCIVTLHFKDLPAEEVILLKHLFYKRLLVNIQERECSMKIPNDCSCCTAFECCNGDLKKRIEQTTIQDYVNKKFCHYYIPSMLDYDVDYRARYSFLELHDDLPEIRFDKQSPICNFWKCNKDDSFIRQLYGMFVADEGHEHVNIAKCHQAFSENISHRSEYSLYLCGLNAIMVNHSKDKRRRCKEEQKLFEKRYNSPQEDIHAEHIEGLCIPGLLEESFPSFLKSIEIHYLINKVTTNEIILHDRSYLYPWIFLKRLILLWGILYELDSHKYHINKDFHKAFGIPEQMESIRQEYNSLLTYTLSFFMGIIAVLTMVVTLLQLWK